MVKIDTRTVFTPLLNITRHFKVSQPINGKKTIKSFRSVPTTNSTVYTTHLLFTNFPN